MYKISSDLSQRRSRQLWLADLQTDLPQHLSPEERRDSLKARLRQLDAEIVALPVGEERSQLGKIKCDLQSQMHDIRPKLKGKPSVQSHFITVARESLPKWQYAKIMAEASRRAEQESDNGPSEQIG